MGPLRIYLSDSATRKLVNAGRKREIPLYISLFAREFGAAVLSKLPNVAELREASPAIPKTFLPKMPSAPSTINLRLAVIRRRTVRIATIGVSFSVLLGRWFTH